MTSLDVYSLRIFYSPFDAGPFILSISKIAATLFTVCREIVRERSDNEVVNLVPSAIFKKGKNPWERGCKVVCLKAGWSWSGSGSWVRAGFSFSLLPRKSSSELVILKWR